MRDLIKQEVRDEESLAVRVADKAEERLWKWSKILGIGGALAVIGLGAFGITSFESAKKQIENASIAASQDLKSVSDTTKRTMEQRSSETLAQIGKSGGETIARMQKEGEETRTAANSVSIRVKASDTKMAEIEQQQASQLNTLASIRTQSPDTPIGSISTDLFKSTGFGTGGLATLGIGGGYGGTTTDLCSGLNPPPYCPGATNVSMATLLALPYKEGGRDGEGVKEIQDRLGTLGCYSGQSTGTFDSLTAQGVDAFVATNGRPSKDMYRSALSGINAPSVFVNDDSAGTVDHDLWESIFSPAAKHCPAAAPQQ